MSDISRNAPELIILGEKWEANNEQRIAVADRLIKAIGTNKKLLFGDNSFVSKKLLFLYISPLSK